MTARAEPSFRIQNVRVKDIQVKTEDYAKNKEGVGKLTLPNSNNRRIVTEVTVGDEPFKPTERFWVSLCSRFGIPGNIFKWFDHDEVFKRISEKSATDTVRICTENSRGGARGILLGATNPAKPLITYDSLNDVLDLERADSMYHEGIVTSTHDLRHGRQFRILGEAYTPRFTMDVPIDGYGMPNIYLNLLRMICTNGAIAYAKAFRSNLSLGKGEDDVSFAIQRALQSFNNEEGFSALCQRLTSAGSSWASLNEALALGKRIYCSTNVWRGKTPEARDVTRKTVIDRYRETVGDMTSWYGLAQMDALSQKKLRTLPAKCKVYDLINFASEAATHHIRNPEQQRKLHGYIGGLISQEYDLEGTSDQFGSYQDIFVEKKTPAVANG